MSEETTKKVWRYCPFSWYDTEYLAHWLEEQASKGLILSSNGFLGPFIALKKKQPTHMRYQSICALPKTDDVSGMVSMIEDMGWHQVCNARITDIYATEDMNAPDLHSEAATEIMDIKRMHRWIFWDYLIYILVFSLLPITDCFDYYHGHLATLVPSITVGLTTFVWVTFRYICRRKSFFKQIQHLRNNITFSEQDYNRYKKAKNWQRIISITILAFNCLSPIIFHWL